MSWKDGPSGRNQGRPTQRARAKETAKSNCERENAMAERSETEMKRWSQLVAQAWTDDNLKRRLLENPASVLREHGIPVPAGVEVKVVENTDKVTYLTLPAKPAG